MWQDDLEGTRSCYVYDFRCRQFCLGIPLLLLGLALPADHTRDLWIPRRMPGSHVPSLLCFESVFRLLLRAAHVGWTLTLRVVVTGVRGTRRTGERALYLLDGSFATLGLGDFISASRAIWSGRGHNGVACV